MKGIVHALVALGIIFIVWILILSFAFNLTSISQRQLAESKTFFDAEEVENIVRSIENSFKLSFVQSVYDSVNTGEYWQNNNQNFLTDDKIISIKNSIVPNFEEYTKKFLNEYSNYVKINKEENTLLQDSLKNAKIDVNSIITDLNFVKIDVKPIVIQSEYRIVKGIKTNLDFDYKIDTRIFQFFDVAKNFISSDRLRSSVMNGLREYISGFSGGAKDLNSDPPKIMYSKEFCPEKGETEPSAEQLFNFGSGKLISQAQQEAGKKISFELRKVEQEFTDFQKSFSIVDKDIINPIASLRGITTEITSTSCSISEAGKCYEVIESVGTIEKGDKKQKQCTYLFYGTVNSKIEIKDSGKKYSLWDKLISQNIFDSLKISFNAISGNKEGVTIPTVAIQLRVSGSGSGPNCAVYDSKCGPSLAVCKVDNIDCRQKYNFCEVFPYCTAGSQLNSVYFIFKIKNAGNAKDTFTIVSDEPQSELVCSKSVPDNKVTLESQQESEFMFTCGFLDKTPNKEWSVKVSTISNNQPSVKAVQTLSIKYVR